MQFRRGSGQLFTEMESTGIAGFDEEHRFDDSENSAASLKGLVAQGQLLAPEFGGIPVSMKRVHWLIKRNGVCSDQSSYCHSDRSEGIASRSSSQISSFLTGNPQRREIPQPRSGMTLLGETPVANMKLTIRSERNEHAKHKDLRRKLSRRFWQRSD